MTRVYFHYELAAVVRMLHIHAGEIATYHKPDGRAWTIITIRNHVVCVSCENPQRPRYELTVGGETVPHDCANFAAFLELVRTETEKLLNPAGEA